MAGKIGENIACEVCGEPFEKRSGTHRYCLKAGCKQEGLRRAVEAQKERRKSYREKERK